MLIQCLFLALSLSPPLLWQNWDTDEWWKEAPAWDELTVMIPRKPQEGPRADSARRAPHLLTQPPAGRDAAGQKKEVPVITGAVIAWDLGPREPSHWSSESLGTFHFGSLSLSNSNSSPVVM